MEYKPNEIITYGVHKGYPLYKVYKFDPTYIEWLIKYTKEFTICLESFTILPKPTPYSKQMRLTEMGNGFLEYNIESVIPFAELFLDNGGILKEFNFKFSNEIAAINELKKIILMITLPTKI